MWNGNGMWLPQPSSWQSFVWQACLWTSNLCAHHLSVMVDKVRQLCKVRFSWKRNAVRVNKLSLQTNKSPLDNSNGQNSWFSLFHSSSKREQEEACDQGCHTLFCPMWEPANNPIKLVNFFHTVLFCCISLSVFVSLDFNKNFKKSGKHAASPRGLGKWARGKSGGV